MTKYRYEIEWQDEPDEQVLFAAIKDWHFRIEHTDPDDVWLHVSQEIQTGHVIDGEFPCKSVRSAKVKARQIVKKHLGF